MQECSPGSHVLIKAAGGGTVSQRATSRAMVWARPLVLATLLPQAPAQWLLRLTPAAAFGLQQDNPHYSQVSSACLPYNGCYPLAPWAGFAVLCAWAVAALGVASYMVRRRDA